KVRAIADNTDLVLFCGSDDLAFESFVQGATGWVSVAANIAPNSAAKLYDLVKAGKYDEAKALNKDLLPLCEFLEDSGKYVQIVKKAMDLKGLNRSEEHTSELQSRFDLVCRLLREKKTH